jgi:Ca2+/Na+ antiporter
VIVAQQELKVFHALILVFSYLFYLLLLRKGMGLGNKDKPADRIKYHIPAVRLTIRHLLFLDLKNLLLNGRQLNRTNAWATLVISTAVMSLGTWMLVEGTKLLGEKSYGEGGFMAELLGLRAFHGLGIPVVFLSVLLAAAATSIPDTMISVRDSRKGNHDDAISNAIGSNIFDISFAIGFPLLLYALIHGNVMMSDHIQLLSFGILIAMWFINIAVVLLFIPRNMNIRLRAAFLLLLYLLFIAFIISERNENFTQLLKSTINFIQKLF